MPDTLRSTTTYRIGLMGLLSAAVLTVIACSPQRLSCLTHADGCASAPPALYRVTGLPLGETAANRAVGLRNFTVLEELYSKERAYYRGTLSNGGPPGLKARPDLCLALSGGGLRSAAFSVGVLAGMQKADMLDQVDVVSAVSGGSYALTWMFAQQIANPKASRSEVFFGTKGANGAVNRLISQPRFVEQSQAVTEFVSLGLFKSLFDVVERRLRDRHPPTLSHNHYKRRILATFYGDYNVRWNEVSSLLNDGVNRNPFPILNAVAIDRDLVKVKGYRDPSIEQVFEISPLRVGSDSLRFEDNHGSLDLADSAAISGAAVDESYGPYSAFFGFFKGGLGYTYSRAPSVPVWWVNGKPAHVLYLTDGGFAENLGAYTLVKRLCKRIIVVDAEEDPELRFEAYWLLKANLRRTMNVNLVVQAIEGNRLGTCSAAIGGSDAAQQHPVFTGTIGNFPLGLEGEASPIHIHYVKLSWNPAWASYPNDHLQCVGNYIGREAAATSLFPHDPTKITAYSEPQLRAYVNLGHGIITQWLAPSKRATGQASLGAVESITCTGGY